MANPEAASRIDTARAALAWAKAGLVHVSHRWVVLARTPITANQIDAFRALASFPQAPPEIMEVAILMGLFYLRHPSLIATNGGSMP